MEKQIIFLNGEYSSNNEEIKKLCEGRKIIAVDGGCNKVYELSLIPFKIVGDLDSIDKNVLEYYKAKKVSIVSLIKDKDYTDFEVALLDIVPDQKSRFKEKSTKESNFFHLKDIDIMVLGATGNRIDMTLSNLKKLHKIPSMYFITNRFETIKYINKSTKFKNLKNKTFSIIPITDIENMSLKGFKYLLNNNNISKDLGLASNVVINDDASIEFDNGEMYIIYD